MRKQLTIPYTVFFGDSFRATLFLLSCVCAVNHFSVRKHRAVKQIFIYLFMKMLQIITCATSPPCLSATLCSATVDWSIYHSQHIEKKERDGPPPCFMLLSRHTHTQTYTHTHKLFSFRKLACRAPPSLSTPSSVREERKHGWYEFYTSLQSQRLADALLHQGIPGDTDNLSVSSYLHSEPQPHCSVCESQTKNV